MAKNLKIVKIWDVKPTQLKGGGKSRRMITKKRVGSTLISMGVLMCDLGKGHDWHSHPRGEEEAYYIVHGTGTLSWERDGEVVSKEVTEGCAVFTPSDVRNQIVNTGSEPLVLVWGISPPKE